MRELIPFLGAAGGVAAIVAAFRALLFFQSERANVAIDQADALLDQGRKLGDDMRSAYERMREEVERVRSENESLHRLIGALTEKNLELGREVERLRIQVDRLCDHHE